MTSSVAMSKVVSLNVNQNYQSGVVNMTSLLNVSTLTNNKIVDMNFDVLTQAIRNELTSNISQLNTDIIAEMVRKAHNTVLVTEDVELQQATEARLVAFIDGLILRQKFCRAIITVYKDNKAKIKALNVDTTTMLFNYVNTKQHKQLLEVLADMNGKVSNNVADMLVRPYNNAPSVIEYVQKTVATIEAAYAKYTANISGSYDPVFTCKNAISAAVDISYYNKTYNISIKSMVKYLPYVDSVILIKFDSKNKCYTDVKHKNKLMLVKTFTECELDLNGLDEFDANKCAVFLIRNEGKNVLDRVSDLYAANNAVFGMDEVEAANYQDSRKQIAELIQKLGYTNPILETAIQNGYVVTKESIANDNMTDTAFLTADGWSYEDAKKTVVRQGKLALAAKRSDSVAFVDVNVMTVGTTVFEPVKPEHVRKDMYLNVYTDASLKASYKLAIEFARLFGTGQSYANDELYKFIGTARLTSGSKETDSGMKTVVVGVRENTNGLLYRLMEAATARFGTNSRFMIQGTNSAKSVKFHMESDKVEEQYNNASFTAVYSVETLYVTDSYTCNNLEYTAKYKWTDASQRLAKVLGFATQSLKQELLGKSCTYDEAYALPDRILNMIADGVIRVKQNNTETNSQLINMLYGRDPDMTQKMINELLDNPANKELRSIVRTQTVRLLGKDVVKGVNANVVPFVKLIASVQNVVNLVKPYDISGVVGKSVNLFVVNSAAKMLAKSGVTAITDSNGNKVTFVLDENAFADFANKSEYSVSYEGVLGALFAALDKVITSYFELEDNDDGGVSLVPVITDEAKMFEMFQQIMNAELDKLVGKIINKLKAPGFYGVLVSSVHLEENEVFSYRIGGKDEGLVAESRAFYGQRGGRVSFFLSKFPVIINDSSRVFDGKHDIKLDQLTARFVTLGDDAYRVLAGNSVFCAPYTILVLGNDTDGDLIQVMGVMHNTTAGSVFVKGKRASKNAMRNVTESLFGNQWLAKVTSECKLTFKAGRTMQQLSVEDLTAGALESVQEKSNVAIVTNLQSMLIRQKGHVQAMMADLKSYHATRQALLANNVDVDHFVSYVIDLTIDMVGVLVNNDGMDRVKHENGAGFTRVSDLFLSTDVKFGSKVYHTFAVSKGIYAEDSIFKNTKVNKLADKIRVLLTGATEDGVRAYKGFSLDALNGWVDNQLGQIEFEVEKEFFALVANIVTIAHGLDTTTYDPMLILFNKTMKSGSVETENEYLSVTKGRLKVLTDTAQTYLVLKMLNVPV